MTLFSIIGVLALRILTSRPLYETSKMCITESVFFFLNFLKAKGKYRKKMDVHSVVDVNDSLKVVFNEKY